MKTAPAAPFITIPRKAGLTVRAAEARGHIFPTQMHMCTHPHRQHRRADAPAEGHSDKITEEPDQNKKASTSHLFRFANGKIYKERYCLNSNRSSLIIIITKKALKPLNGAQ